MKSAEQIVAELLAERDLEIVRLRARVESLADALAKAKAPKPESKPKEAKPS